ncbi:MAG: LacI family DNA-binding transcriptional regulator [Gammaproteobacteria bacterium]|nr:LacI family DNA-binding transcriptional regulator [Gammaproteobacteria bacterium]MDH3767799.1 LacI family DNA-binding transcriptional regulator [Gammaproteobacteria bacterium]
MSTQGPPRATIADVARLAGVSIKTVSRVANNEANVREGTRTRVLRVIDELNYQPNPSARNLAARRSYLIGLIYDNPSASYLINIQDGALNASRAAGYDLIIHPCVYKDPNLKTELQMMISQSKIDGLILTPPLSDMDSVVELLLELGMPFVRIAPADRSDLGRAIYTNDEQACAEMTVYLNSLGHTDIAFVIGHPDHGAVGQRFDGYKAGLNECGLPLRKEWVAQGYNSFESGIECAQQLLDLDNPPSAIFASNDDMAAGVMKVAHERNLSIPGDLSVAGFDDIPLASYLWPALTTIRQPIQSMASAATDLLLTKFDARRTDDFEHIVKSKLIIRDSTGPA